MPKCHAPTDINTTKAKRAAITKWLETEPAKHDGNGFQGSDTRVCTQENPVGFFWVHPPKKTHPKKPTLLYFNLSLVYTLYATNKAIFYCFKAFKALSYWFINSPIFPPCPKKPQNPQNPLGWAFFKKNPGFFNPDGFTRTRLHSTRHRWFAFTTENTKTRAQCQRHLTTAAIVARAPSPKNVYSKPCHSFVSNGTGSAKNLSIAAYKTPNQQ